MNYILSIEAKIDLENIWLYSMEKWSKKQADQYLNLLIDEAEYLCVDPTSGVNYSGIRLGYYKKKVKSHFIFYKINRQLNQIEIIRILHQRMDIESHL